MFQRNNGGIEDVSIGGATMVAIQYKDQDGVYNFEDYYKWADDTDANTMLGFSTAIAASLLCAIF